MNNNSILIPNARLGKQLAELADLEWQGAYEELKTLCTELGANDIPDRVRCWI